MSTGAVEPQFFKGELLAGVQLLKPLRVHAAAECWLCAQEETGELAVAKFLRRGGHRAEQFRKAAELLACSRCPYLIGVLRHGETRDGIPYAVMEYADGGTLRRLLTRHGALPLRHAVYLLRGLMTALAELERAGCVHRDIKPENIWLVGDGSFRLGDFGIAKLDSVSEVHGRVFGTPGYMSPEQAMDSARVDFRSDLYSVAVVMYEALTGERYRAKGAFVDVVKGILADDSESPFETLAHVATANLARLMCAMLSREVDRRPRNATEILVQLDAFELPMACFGQ